MRVLIIEDEEALASAIARGLRREGMAVDVALDGAGGLQKALVNGYDVVVLDRNLPGLHGDEVCRRLVTAESQARILMLTAARGLRDKVAGLNLGADDYLGKPFAFEELMARLTALARRPTLGASQTLLVAGDLEMDLVARSVRRGGEAIDPQPREFRLLEFLMRAEGRLVTRKMLLEQVWEYHFDPKTNIVETHISRLRGKVDCGGPSLIQTVRGAGYMLRVPNPAA